MDYWPVRRTSHTVDPKCMVVLYRLYDMVMFVCCWYFGGISLSFRVYSYGLMFFRYFRRPWQGEGMIVPLLMFLFYDMVLGIL